MEKFLHFRIHSRSANDYFFETSSQSIDQFFTDLCINLSVEQWNAECPFHSFLINERLNGVFIYFLNNERNSDNQIGFHFFESFHDDFRRGGFAEQCDMGAYSCSCQEVESTAIGMCQWEERKYFISFFQQLGTDTESNVACQIVSG